MQRAIDLASNGLGEVSPNPLVGCVIVHENKVIGEGWHQVYGGPHAEVNAIANVTDKELLQASTVYVNLEPCSHHGKTPPCADLLVSHQVKQVVIANRDPFPQVDGAGVAILNKNGIDVQIGVLDQHGRYLNKRFLTFYQKKRPYIILKWAQTSDGFIAKSDFDSKWISSAASRKLVHKWRTEEDAILVGTNTAHYDDPQLTARDWPGSNPLRMVIDRQLKLPENLNLFDSSTATVCYNLKEKKQEQNIEWVKLNDDSFLDDLLKDLNNREVQSLIVEGGSATINSFIDRNLWDEARVFIAPAKFTEGISAPRMKKNPAESTEIGADRLEFYNNH